jgi:spermidine synthase
LSWRVRYDAASLAYCERPGGPLMASSTLTTTQPQGAARVLPWLLVLFAGSGCAALIYEIVWYQMLELVIGSTAVSLGVLLAAYMGGLCLGSVALPRWMAGRKIHPLKVYACLEAGIGALGLLALGFIPLVDRVYVAAASEGLPSMLLRGMLAGLILLPPTILMGASLPAIVNWVESTPRGVAWWGLLYGGNIAGAVLGCLTAGYYLLRVSNMRVTTLAAVGVNAVVAGASWLVAQRTPAAAGLAGEAGARPAGAKRDKGATSRWAVMATTAMSGFVALGAEVVWTRNLSLLLGATVYTFSLILAVFLLGMGLGSAAGAWLGKRARARAALAWTQLGLAGGVAWAAWMLGASLPYWPVNPLLSTSPWYVLQIDMVRALWMILPAAVLFGMSFTLALKAAGKAGEAPGETVGGVYAANTLGGIVGALGFSLYLVPWIGTTNCEKALIVGAAISGLFVMREVFEPFHAAAAVGVGAALIAAAYLAKMAPGVPPELIAYGRRIAISEGQSTILYTGEGRNASIAVSRWNDGALQFHVSGKVEASTETFDMRLQRMLGDLPALLRPGLQRALIVGFGAGVTAGTFTLFPSVRRIHIVEIEPLIPPMSTKFFGPYNYYVKHDPRTRITYDDARHFMLTAQGRYDVITSDPIHPWVKGSATLYSKEYFQMERDHLNPGGLVTQWIPLYESDAAAVKSELATFFSVFPDGTVWANAIDGQGYDLFVLGSNGPLHIDADALQRAFDAPAMARVARSLREVGIQSADDLLANYAGQASGLRAWLRGAAINTDDNLRLQYLAGLALNVSDENGIYDEILSYRRFPAHLITGSAQALAPLQAALGPR